VGCGSLSPKLLPIATPQDIKDLEITFHDFLQQGAHRGALEVLFVGSEMALHRSDKMYMVEDHVSRRKCPITA
jgi:hypothetical protein